ncbi:MAG TPA: ABC transporter C-terminal domain-containing protein, partial [Pirellulaceae bacterium]|nr:ABC transporter C-terminal domain-containing protein [Pirellulaceae bacterium]
QGLAGQATVAKVEAAATPAKRQESATSKPKRKRKYPYRKVPEIEAEIAQREQRIEAIHLALASPEVLRDGEKVKQAKNELDEHQLALPRLYEHWEEASELNS